MQVLHGGDSTEMRWGLPKTPPGRKHGESAPEKTAAHAAVQSPVLGVVGKERLASRLLGLPVVRRTVTTGRITALGSKPPRDAPYSPSPPRMP